MDARGNAVRYGAGGEVRRGPRGRERGFSPAVDRSARCRLRAEAHHRPARGATTPRGRDNEIATVDLGAVALAAGAQVPVNAAVYDRAGQRLAVVTLDGETSLTRTLVPGVYFVRLQADVPADEAAYAVELRSAPLR